MIEKQSLLIRPLTPDRLADFERLFGPGGACGGCWCTFWKLRGKAYSEDTGEPARQMQRSVVEAGIVPGLLAFSEGQPIGWIAVELRGVYPRLAYSRILQPVDDSPVWSITCFFVDKKYRRKGVTVELLKAAIDHVKKQGGRIVEGYPTDTQKSMPAPFIYTGTASAFQQAGFVEVARRSASRPIFRYMIGEK